MFAPSIAVFEVGLLVQYLASRQSRFWWRGDDHYSPEIEDAVHVVPLAVQHDVKRARLAAQKQWVHHRGGEFDQAHLFSSPADRNV
jgi:hypothetical protein